MELDILTLLKNQNALLFDGVYNNMHIFLLQILKFDSEKNLNVIYFEQYFIAIYNISNCKTCACVCSF